MERSAVPTLHHTPRAWRSGRRARDCQPAALPLSYRPVERRRNKGADYGQHRLLPEKQFADFQAPPKSIAESVGHHAEWLRACKTGAATTCPFAYSGLLTEANHLGNVAYRAGKRIEWDAKTQRIRNAPEAEQFLGREPRKGWTLG